MDQDIKLEQLLTVKQVCELLNVKHRRLANLGIPVIQFGRFKRYDPTDIRAWLGKYRVDPDRARETSPTWNERRKLRAAEMPLPEWVGAVARAAYPADPVKHTAYQRRADSARAAWERRWQKRAAERGRR